ncbi:ABC transporter ATP-binding protein [Peribacillus sp. SI8-4]|uniref:ATP-binding cassette domain-containing protein n=1 Tax=Peribacillus sp. SI8-4 TaxID=3048009 RepID=UPI0025573D86|nr:ABC transporter ATP-binding protein [Peribacillus sp. SI8-4]
MISLYIKEKRFESFELIDIPVEIKKGEATLLLGHNGAGKTTIIKSLFGLLNINGNVKLDDHKICFQSQGDVDLFKKNMAYIPDDISLLNYLTPMEYFDLVQSSFNQSENIEFLNQLIRIFELDKYLHIPIIQLSHGNQKKIQIVSQLCRKSEYVVFDEPTNGLDPDMIIILKRVLEKLKSQGVGILLSTHNLDFGQELFNRLIILRDGKIIINMNREEVEERFTGLSLEEVYRGANKEYYQYIEELINDMDHSSSTENRNTKNYT